VKPCIHPRWIVDIRDERENSCHLPPGAFGSASSASIGKMYTFRLIG
jgi:hypothetical protein